VIIQDRYLSNLKLHSADGAAFNHRTWEHHPLCLPNTRVDLLQQIITWSENPNAACIFWLNGMAGTGKSTIARTIACTCANQKRLGASFFFSRGRGDLSNATKFFTTLAAQLAHTLPALKPYICRAIAENPDISQRVLREQWKHLIFQPLSNLKALQSQLLIFVIDALDECDNENDTQLILRLLAESKTLKTVRLRIFVTSRPETPIRCGFRDIPEAHQDFVLHTIPQHIIEHDISIFLHQELEKIRKENDLSGGWPDENRIELLCQKSGGLFIYASTACRFIQDDPEECLSLLLEDGHQELDDMYTEIMSRSIIDRKSSKKTKSYEKIAQKRLNDLRRIVGSVVIFFDSLPATMLARLLDMPVDTVFQRLHHLHSVLDVPESPKAPILLLHPSFRDFLLDPQRCADPRFWIDEKKAHNDLFVDCVELMSKHLKRDMCNLQLPGALTSEVEKGVIEVCLPLDVQYACRFWIYHFQRGNIEICGYSQVHTFLQTHFLHWLEALSLTGNISDGVLGMRALESMLTVSEFIASCSTSQRLI
jgi:hypothetical protein